MPETVLFTIGSKNYLAFTRTLLHSVGDVHDDLDFAVVLADEIDGCFIPEEERFAVIEARNLGIPDFHQMAFKYDIMEFNTAIKPFAMNYFRNKGYRKVIYMDPDIRIFRRLDRIVDLLDKFSVVLTPHTIKPIPSGDSFSPSEQELLQSGAYNLGFIAVSFPGSHDFIQWWSEKCATLCYVEKETGLFVDQKFIDLVPSLFEAVYILKDPGYNMAYWNLHERVLENMRVNGQDELVFYHFSGILFKDLHAISKYQNRYTLDIRPDLQEIFHAYRDKVMENGYEDTIHWPYRYAEYENGDPIGQLARRCYTMVEQEYPEPFCVGPGSYHQLLKRSKMWEKLGRISVSKDQVSKEKNLLNGLLKLSSRLLGMDRYNALMKYMRYISIIRHQEFLLKRD